MEHIIKPVYTAKDIEEKRDELIQSVEGLFAGYEVFMGCLVVFAFLVIFLGYSIIYHNTELLCDYFFAFGNMIETHISYTLSVLYHIAFAVIFAGSPVFISFLIVKLVLFLLYHFFWKEFQKKVSLQHELYSLKDDYIAAEKFIGCYQEGHQQFTMITDKDSTVTIFYLDDSGVIREEKKIYFSGKYLSKIFGRDGQIDFSVLDKAYKGYLEELRRMEMEKNHEETSVNSVK